MLSRHFRTVSVVTIVAAGTTLSAFSLAQEIQPLMDTEGRHIGDVQYLPMETFPGFGERRTGADSPAASPRSPEIEPDAAPAPSPGSQTGRVIDTASPDGAFHGSEGNDTFDVEDVQPLSISDPGGFDTIRSIISRDLEDFPDIEHLTLVGDADTEALGSVKANRLIGNSGNNLLVGRGGADHLAGGAGDDIYVLEAATNDTIEDSAGNDTITSTITRDLSDYVGIENLELTFSAHIDGFGDEGPNFLRGNAGNNKLVGRGGDDILDGGKGADTLTGGSGKDRFVLSVIGDTKSSAGHRDIITDFTSGEDIIDLSQVAPVSGLVFIGETAFSGAAGEVRWFKKNKDWIILGIDVDGDGLGDAEIEIAPVRQIVAADLAQ